MSTTKPLTQERVRKILDAKSVMHVIDDDGDIGVVLGADDDVSYDVVVYIIIRNGMFLSRGIPNKNIAGSKKVDAVIFSNQWNSEKMWPTVFFNEKTNKVESKITTDCSMEVHDEMLVDLVNSSLGLTWAVYKELEKNGM